MSRMTYMQSWKSHRLTSHTWLGLNPQFGRPLSRIVGAIGLFFLQNSLELSIEYRCRFCKSYFDVLLSRENC
jgi:hypothetical protein